MAPMIDMVFLLLVFFMTASAMSTAGNKVELELPEAPSSELPNELSHRLIVSIKEDGELYFGGLPILESELGERLTNAKENEPRIKLRIRADKETAFEKVKAVMRLASQAGIESYLYATYQGEAGS